MALEKSVSTIRLPRNNHKKHHRASKIANTSSLLESQTPTYLENMSKTSPLPLRRTPPIPTGSSLPFAAPSTLKFKTLRGGRDQKTKLLTFVGPQPIQPSKFTRISIREKLENSFLNTAHVAILKVILAINLATDDDVPPKILSFLSFQIDHKIAKRINLKRIRPHPAKCPPIQDSTVPANNCGIHHAMPHLAMKLLQTLASTSQ
eukprot:TRINITY_DN27786_c0_g1_i1.p1 TRINITY_DN27786_c0_g1~~TRINITY_DN27786_c0_g1_i1.p1  ORF type:complete len:213 (-),score=2.87 TRINITY_DN27786_c0_g1_i1:292-906(-)